MFRMRHRRRKTNRFHYSRHADKTMIYAQAIDNVGTMNRTQKPLRENPKRLNCLSITRSKAVKMVLVSIVFSISTSGYSYAAPQSQTDNYRIYAHIKIYDFRQFLCFNLLIDRESMWSPNANNGNHYGLGQGMSKDLLRMNPYQQIDWSIKYIINRYKTECNALKHSDDYGWY